LVIVSPRDLLRHHGEVRHRGDQRAVAGRRTQYRGEQRDASGAPRLREQVGRGPGAVVPVGAEARAFEHHDQRHAIGHRDLRDPVPLRVGRLADRPGLHREVLGRDHDRPTVDPSRAGHDRVGRQALAPDQRPELLEGTRVEQVVDPRPDVELAAGVLLRQPLVAPHGARGDPPFAQVVEGRGPIRVRRRVSHCVPLVFGAHPAPPGGNCFGRSM
jgi:hypothetical protein